MYFQVEDQTTDLVSKCWESLTEFMKGMLDYPNVIDPPSFSTITNRPYSPSDAMIQYAYIFTQLRKPSGAAITPAK